MTGEINPWIAMWTQPRTAIRSILHTNPRYGIFYLASIYALQNMFYMANYWSLGISVPFYKITATALVFSPIIGMIWVYLAGWILKITGKCLQGRASVVELRAAYAWSKLPTTIALLMWIVLLAAHPDYAFILDAAGPSSLFIHFINMALGIWCFALLVQSIREVQSFSLGRSLLNVIIAWFSSWALLIFFAFFFRYLYVLVV